ncbi:hypothetical protein EDC04DRAFT_1399737 [Pisolithus marmoratus]|nr:hypothetical protein EDC04DRAFT_1399737 [Pisolithus marmoratus]
MTLSLGHKWVTRLVSFFRLLLSTLVPSLWCRHIGHYDCMVFVFNPFYLQCDYTALMHVDRLVGLMTFCTSS